MNTTADKLELLLRTKERQKAYLQEKYPLLDFDTIPFRAYLDLFQGRSYVPGFVGGWKAYGRSNDEDASTRGILPDYSGNGRDIELFNFAFDRASGYGGEVAFMPAYWSAGGKSAIAQIDPGVTVINDGHYEITRIGANLWVILEKDYAVSGNYSFPQYEINVKGLEGGTLEYKYCCGEDFNEKKTANLQNGRNIISGESFNINTLSENVAYIELVTENAVFTKLDIYFSRQYPGALVSDGIDDYGIVDNLPVFTKETGYTVLAIRKWVDDTPLKQSFVSKLNNSDTLGAFSFEISESSKTNTYSFGGSANTVTYPALFSYQTLDKYNSEKLTNIGTSIDGSLLYLFRGRDSYINPAKVVLYDLRIYDHSLTAEELQTVKDEMMQDYENATGGGYS